MFMYFVFNCSFIATRGCSFCFDFRYIAHVVVPTQKDIEDALLRRKKQELLQMYALEDVEHVSRDSQLFKGLGQRAETRRPKK